MPLAEAGGAREPQRAEKAQLETDGAIGPNRNNHKEGGQRGKVMKTTIYPYIARWLIDCESQIKGNILIYEWMWLNNIMLCSNIREKILKIQIENSPATPWNQLLVSAQFNPIGLFQRDAAGIDAFTYYKKFNFLERKGSCTLKDFFFYKILIKMIFSSKYICYLLAPIYILHKV